MPRDGRGWHKEPVRHGLAAKGIRTSRKWEKGDRNTKIDIRHFIESYYGGDLRAEDVRVIILNESTLPLGGIDLLTHRHGIFQFWNKEYAKELATHIKRHQMEPVLEIAAGDGVLSMMLRERGVDIVATDIKGRKREAFRIVERAPVETAEAFEAIRKYRPKTVIISWIPASSDLDRKLLQESGVQNILIIGEHFGGATGSIESDEEAEKIAARAGYKLSTLPSVDAYNYGRTDFPVGGKIRRHSRTALFSMSGGKK